MIASSNYQIIPSTDAPAQTINVTLNQQACRIDLYTKSINVPIQVSDTIPSDPFPTYENINPVFIDLYVNETLVIGGVLCRSGTKIVRDAYLGFIGDLAVLDLEGSDDPQGVPARLPPPDLRNWWQRSVPLRFGGKAPPALANKIPGFGTRWILTYWPNLT
jgi:hypothetical protein